jgi:CDP-diacylglycerol--serine O-phosphatidyltransferase
MKNIKFVFPNTLTLINLVLGCAAITVTLVGENEYNAAWIIIIAAIFDVFDGFVAKALNARSDFGIQLDSLADMVSFGVAPSIIFYKWFLLVLTKLSPFSTFELISANFAQYLILSCSFLFAVAAAIRLARFNISPADKKIFKGLPSTSAALIVASIWLILKNCEPGLIQSTILNIYFVFPLLAILIFLMLSNLKMLSVKFNGLSFEKNLMQYIIIVASVILMLIFKTEGIFLSLMFYLLLSLIINFARKAEA